ncbi:AAA family ATPase [Neobacillus sp. NPDC093127]|uniref:AAA family ATPase n=1 Tax=Neobacillus sp. NPDC093127 TaxID=3364296 RepID=UPI00382FFAEA
MQISEKKANALKKNFVGRSKEMEIIHRHIAGDWKWQWIHIYGQSGIGKTTFLQYVTSEIKGACFYFLDGSQGIIKKDDVLAQLAKQLDHASDSKNDQLDSEVMVQQMNNKARSIGKKHILVMDAFDHFRSVEKWLTEWLEQLDENIRIITAGQHPLTGRWLHYGWANLIYTLHLPALTSVEVQQFARKQGIADTQAQSDIYQFSRGIPLALTLAAELMLQTKGDMQFNRQEKTELLNILMEKLFSELPLNVCKLLEAASVFWKFNEERLASIINEEMDAFSFRKLTMMPYVFLKEDGWMVHDAVRAWVLEDLLLRKPLKYEEMRKKALNQIWLEERKNPKLRKKLHLDKMNLHENPMVRNICFSGQLEDVELRACREIDIPAIQSLYVRYHHYILPIVPEERYMEKLIRPIWEVVPTSFITIWERNELIAFYCKVPLHAEMLEILATEPILQPFLSKWKPTTNAYSLLLMGIEPKLEDKTSAYIVNTMINHLSFSEWILDFTCFKEWFPVLELCGFSPAPWANATTQYGTEYRAFILDLTQEDYLTKLDRLLTSRGSEKKVTKSPQTQDIQDLKSVLKEWNQLISNPALSDTYFRLFPHRMRDSESVKSLGISIQKEVSNIITQLIKESEREATYGKLLKYRFLQGNHSHEKIAERLNLSMATYYRYLNKALEHLYQLLSM